MSRNLELNRSIVGSFWGVFTWEGFFGIVIALLCSSVLCRRRFMKEHTQRSPFELLLKETDAWKEYWKRKRERYDRSKNETLGGCVINRCCRYKSLIMLLRSYIYIYIHIYSSKWSSTNRRRLQIFLKGTRPKLFRILERRSSRRTNLLRLSRSRTSRF